MRRHFYDVGANVGQTFDQYLLPGDFRAYDVFCFEPSPRHLTALRVKADAMASHFRGVTIVPVAVGAGSGFARIYEKRSALGDSIMKDLGENLETSVAVVAPLMPLSAFFRAYSDEAMVAIKIDVEGAEYDILSDILHAPDLLSRITALHVEWHAGAGQTKTERERLTQQLAAHGVTVQRWPF